MEDNLQLIGPNSSRERTVELFRNGMKIVCYIWNLKSYQLYNQEEINKRFNLTQDDRPF
jgi:hypothetical protein